jgi:predicted nucleic acid-binding protein
VLTEIAKGVDKYPELESISSLEWLHQVNINEFEELKMFATYKGEFGGGPDRNLGESAVLAWTAVNGGIAIVDEEVGRGAALRDGIEAFGSLWLVIRGFRRQILDRATAEGLVDSLIASEMRLPIANGASLFTWAYQQGMLP